MVHGMKNAQTKSPEGIVGNPLPIPSQKGPKTVLIRENIYDKTTKLLALFLF